MKDAKIYLDAMREIYVVEVLNLKMARDRCCPPTWDPDKAEFKVGDIVLLKNHVPTNMFDIKSKASFRICNWISDKDFEVQDSAGKFGCLSIQHLQLLYLAERILIHLPDMNSFGRTMKYTNDPNLMPNLHIPVNAQNKQINGKHPGK